MDHEGGDAEGEALVDHKIPGVSQHCLMEPGHIPQQVVEAVARHPAGGVHVHSVESLHNLGVVGDLKVRHCGLAEPLHLHVGAVIGPNGDRGVDDVGDDQHDLSDFFGQLGLLLLQLGQTVGVGLYLGLGLLRLGQLGGVLLGLAHEHAHPLAEGVPGGPELVGLRHGGPVFRIQLQHLVHQGELLLLEFLFDVLLYGLGIFPDKTDVQHSFSFSFVVMFHVERRRSKLHILRFCASAKAHSFRCSSSPNRTRCAGLRFGAAFGGYLMTFPRISIYRS